MDPTKIDKKYVLLGLALVAPKVKQLTGYQLTVDDIYTLIGAGVIVWHVIEVWQAKLAAKNPSTPAPGPATNPHP